MKLSWYCHRDISIYQNLWPDLLDSDWPAGLPGDPQRGPEQGGLHRVLHSVPAGRSQSEHSVRADLDQWESSLASLCLRGGSTLWPGSFAGIHWGGPILPEFGKMMKFFQFLFVFNWNKRSSILCWWRGSWRGRWSWKLVTQLWLNT